MYCYTQHIFISLLLILKFEAFIAVVTLIRGSVPSVHSLMQFTQLYCYTQHSFVSATSFLKFKALTGVATLTRGGIPTVQNLLKFAQLYHCIQDNCISVGSFLNLIRYCSGHLNQMRWATSSESTAVCTAVFYTQHSFISEVSFLKFDALIGVFTLIRGGVPPFKIFLLQPFNEKFQKFGSCH